MKGSGLFEVRGPKLGEECPEVSIREGPEELTLTAEELGSQKTCVSVGHMAEERWRSLLVGSDWHAFCQAIYKGIEGSEGERVWGAGVPNRKRWIKEWTAMTVERQRTSCALSRVSWWKLCTRSMNI